MNDINYEPIAISVCILKYFVNWERATQKQQEECLRLAEVFFNKSLQVLIDRNYKELGSINEAMFKAILKKILEEK